MGKYDLSLESGPLHHLEDLIQKENIGPVVQKAVKKKKRSFFLSKYVIIKWDGVTGITE